MNYSDKVDELWADLREHLLVGNRPKKYELRALLASCKQGGDSIKAYYSHLKKIWDEIDNHTQLPPTIDAEVLSIITKERDGEKVFQSLIRSNGKIYGTIRSSIIR